LWTAASPWGIRRAVSAGAVVPPIAKIVKRQIHDVALTMPSRCWEGNASAVAYAMAPRRPACHICSCMLPGIGSAPGRLFRSQERPKTLAARPSRHATRVHTIRGMS